MRIFTLFTFLLFFNHSSFCQEKTEDKSHFVLGISGPELLHLGFSIRLTNSNLIGFNAGLAPTWGGLWPTISAEHRLYFGKNDNISGQKEFFFRQGLTWQPSASKGQHFILTLTAGKDLPFKKPGKGITIDAGVFYLKDSGGSSLILIRSLSLWPALRFQFYFP